MRQSHRVKNPPRALPPVVPSVRPPTEIRENPLTTPDDRPRQSMLSVPSNWSDLYFDIFAILCAFGEAFVICYVLLRPPPSGDALEMAADILLRLAAVPVAAGLQAFLIMKGRDLIMKTWERFAQERLERGRREGVEIGTQLAVRRIRERLAQREAAERGERDDWLDEILSEISENGAGNSNGKSE